jgi:hypothetical protein
MTKGASLDRLRDISKQRSIRKPLVVDGDLGPPSVSEQPTPTISNFIEWPIGR